MRYPKKYTDPSMPMATLTLPFLTVHPVKKHTATVICIHVGPFPHPIAKQRLSPNMLLLLSLACFFVPADKVTQGVGDDGRGWKPVTDELAPALPHVKWILPHAPQRPVTIYNREWLRAWFDLHSFTFTEPEDASGMFESVRKLDALVKAEVEAGIPQERIVLSGFSQGGAIVLLTGLGGRPVRDGGEGWKLAGVAVMSGWLPLRDRFRALISPHALTMPVFWGHGTDDPLVRYNLGRKSAEILKDQVGLALRWGDKGEAERLAFGSAGVSFLGYDGVLHATCSKERADLREFLRRVIPGTENDE